MVSTRPKNKLKKIPDGTFIDLSKPKNPKTTVRRRIVMEDEGGSQPEKNVEGSSSPRGESPLETLAGAAEFDILEDVDEEKDTDVEETPAALVKVKQEKASATKKKVVEKGKKPMLRAREEKTLNNVANREIVVPKRIDFELLGELGLAEGVKEKFKAIGWESFLEWDTTSYEELVKEFYSDLQVKMDKEGPEYLEFKLRGVERRVKMDDLNVALKMVEWVDLSTQEYLKAEKVVPNYADSEWNKIWSKFSGQKVFKASVSRGTSIKDHVLRMCHRIIAYNLYGKKDSSNNVSKAELYILEAMESKTRLNFAAFAASHMKGILSRDQRLSLTHLITILAKAYKSIGADPDLVKERDDCFDLPSLKRMFTIKQEENGKLKMLDEREKPPAQPVKAVPKSRTRQSITPEPSQGNTEAALTRIQETLAEIQSALAAYFAHVGFRYPPETS